MTSTLRQLLSASVLLCPLWAYADTCTITASPGFSTSYSGAFTSVLSSFTVDCVRVGGDPNNQPFVYTVSVNNGANSGGADPNKAVSGASFLNYDTYKDSACTTLWGSAAADRLTFTQILSGNSVNTSTVSYYGCIAAGQSVPPSIYTDSVSITVFRGLVSKISGTFPVSINTAAVCSVTAIPNIALSYTAFGAQIAASNSFGATCSNGLGYTMALDRYSDVAAGINYSLALSATSGAGTGVQQNHSVTATAPADQAGTCAASTCTGSQLIPHTLTITY
jgi:spore coat protein U-like protein